MKKVALHIIFSFISFIGFGQVNFTGYLQDEEGNKMKDIIINLYQENDLISTEKWSKKFSYDLEIDKYYTLELTKEGFITKRIAISTFDGDKGAEPFLFVMELLKKRKGVDESELDFPSALIEYKKNRGSFNFNVDYSKSVKKEQETALETK